MKKTWKRFLALAMILSMMCVTLASCGGSNSKEETPKQQETDVSTESATEPLKLKFNCVGASTDSNFKMWEDYFAGLEEVTNGAVQVEVYASEALGPSAEVIEMASNGEAVMAHTDMNYMSNYIPDFAIPGAPYVFQEPQDIRNFWESDIFAEMAQQLEDEYGIKILFQCWYGNRSLIADREVHTRADISKLKVRCAATPMWNEVVRVLGGNAVNTAWSETYSALSQGVADGAEAPIPLLYSSKLYEPCPYVIMTEHVVANTGCYMSSKLFNSLPEETQKIIEEYSYEWCDKAITYVEEAEAECIEIMKAEGVTFVEVDKTEFIEAAADTPAQFPEWTEGRYEEIVEYMNSVRK